MSNLRLINETNVSSGITSVSITDVFTSNFDIYQITFSNLKGVTAEDYVDMSFINSSGSEITSASYDRAQLLMYSDLAFAEDKKVSQTNFDRFLYLRTFTTTGNSSAGEIWVFNPYSSSSYTFYLGQGNYQNTTRIIAPKEIGVLKDTSSVTGFKLTVEPTGELDTLSVRTYGLRVDS